MKRVYLASPYSSGDIDERDFPKAQFGENPSRRVIMEERARLARVATADLMVRGVNAYSPIAHGHDLPVPAHLVTQDAFWKPFNEDEIDRSTEVWVLTLDGWATSTGVTREISYALHTGKPLYLVAPGTYELKLVPCPHAGGEYPCEGDMKCRWCHTVMDDPAPYPPFAGETARPRVSNGPLDTHPCGKCEYAEIDDERHFCGAAGVAVARLDYEKCPQRPAAVGKVLEVEAAK